MAESTQEPTMEEILASIRRIISEDEPAAEEPVAEAEPAGHHAAAAEEDGPLVLEDDVLELTERVHDDPPTKESEPEIDILDFSAPEPEPEPEPTPIPAAAAAAPPTPPPAEAPPMAPDEPLVGAPAASSAASAFDMLERTVMMPAAGRTLEEVVRELLRPMMKGWLDEHLPSIVEAQVAAEVERIARLRR